MRKYYIFITIWDLLMLAIIIGGFFIIGSPLTIKDQAEDKSKINTMRNIQTEIQSYYDTNKKLPLSLSDIQNKTTFNPFNINDFQYTKKTSLNYKLCGTFLTNSNDNKGTYDIFNGYNNSVTYPLPPINTGDDQLDTYTKGQNCYNLSVGNSSIYTIPPVDTYTITPTPTELTNPYTQISGTVKSINFDTHILVLSSDTSSSKTIDFSSDTPVIDSMGNSFSVTDIKVGTKISVSYLYSTDTSITAYSIQIINK